jgi:hypothetical protein
VRCPNGHVTHYFKFMEESVLSWDALREDAKQEAAIAAWVTGRSTRVRWAHVALLRHEQAEQRANARYRAENRYHDVPAIRVAPTPRARGTVKMPTNAGDYKRYLNAQARRRRRRVDL